MFRTPYIFIDEDGIDLIENNQVARHIDFGEIKEIKLIKSSFIENRIISLIAAIGLIFLGYAVLMRWNLNIDNMSFHRGYIAYLLIPFVFVITGLILIFLLIKRFNNILITTDYKKFRIPINKIEKEGRLNDLKEFLRIRTKLIDSV